MIHEIVFQGQGGYDWDTVYNMPIWLRKYTFSKISTYYENRNESQKKAMSGQKGAKTLVDSTGNVNKSEFNTASKPYTKTSYK